MSRDHHIGSMSDPAWQSIETILLRIWSMRHNEISLARDGKTPQQQVGEEIDKIRSGIAGVPREETLRGPMLLLRVVGGRSDRVYSGEWWFDASVLDNLEHAYSRIFFSSTDKTAAIRAMLREILAISTEWNTIAEAFALALPPGERLTAFSGPGNRQQLFANQPLTATGNRLLVGKLRQYYIPAVWSPFWISKYRQLG
jgi:hypothetical protein